MTKKPALGKGLSSLLPPSSRPQPTVVPTGPVTELAWEQIQTNPDQPRKEFRSEQLQELAQSIARDGILQPLVVRKRGEGYELVAGERRLRAAKLAGLQRVPVVVQTIADDRMLEIALIENIQREDLNAIELAQAFERMADELNLNHEEIGARTGKDRATITNAIRLLQLPKDLQDMVARRELSAGHARAVLKMHSEEEQRELARKIVAEGWTVRKAEGYSQPAPAEAKPEKAAPPAIDPNVKAAIDEMERALGTRVKIVEGKAGKGRIEIEYYSFDDLDRIYSLIAKQTE
jgi:ParB family transcriptional regulator, chromosome partitioning protein